MLALATLKLIKIANAMNRMFYVLFILPCPP